MPATTLYAALLSLLFVVLSFRTIKRRRALKIGIGDAENPDLKRAMRVHANFAEYVPLALLLIFFVEYVAAPQILVHGLGAALLLGRALHAYGVSQPREDFRFRVTGMTLTFSVILVCAGTLLVLHLPW
jgi:uncharacterized protein